MKITLHIILAALLLAPLAALHAAEPKVFDITSHGAKGDGTTLNTQMIQHAVDACHDAGGGVVSVPKGVFLTGSLRLKSGVVLRIEKDAILRGSPKIADYTVETAPLHWGGFWKSSSSLWKQCLIYAEDAEQIGIEGPGTIDGQGGSERKVFPNANDPRRPMLVRFERCRRIAVRDVTLLDAAAFTTFFVHSEDIAIERVTIRSRKTPTGDGLDFDGCKRVRIANCDLDTGDDGIGPKTFHPDWPNEDFDISGCRITSRWCAIRVGAESIGAIRRLNVRDCVFTHCQGGIKIESCEGAQFEDLAFTGIEMKQVCQPFMVLASRFAFSAHGKLVRPPVGRIRNVRFKNIRALVGVGEYAGPRSFDGKDDPFKRLCSAVVSRPGTSIEDVSFTNIDITFPGGGTPELASRLDVGELLESSNYVKWATPFDGELPASALYLRHVKGVRLENVRYAVEKPDARAFIAGDDVACLTLQGVVARAPAPVPGLAKLADAKDVVVKDCSVDCGASVPVMVAPTADELRRLAELRTRSAELDREIQQKADEADAAAKKTAAPLAALQAAPSNDAYIVVASEAGAKLDSDVTKGGGTDDTALIQGILDRAPKLGSLKLVVDGAILVKGLKVHSNTTIECLNRGCGFYLADNSNRPIIANATPQPEGRADRNLSFLGGTYNGNAEHQAKKLHPVYGATTAVALHGVEQVLFRDVSICNSRGFTLYLTNWRRVVLENIYINVDQVPSHLSRDGIHLIGPGEFVSIRNVQGRTWDDLIALNIDDFHADWDSEGKFGYDSGWRKSWGSAAGFGSVSDVDIDGVQADDCAQVIRILSRASRLDRVSIRNVKGTYRDFGVWITPYFRDGGNIGRLEFENIDLRPVGPRGYDYVPPFLFWFAGKMEQVTLKSISSHAPIDDRPLVWIQPDAKIDRLRIDGLNVYDPRKEIGHTPLIRADGRIALLQVRDVVVQRPQATSPAGSLIGTSMDRSALKAFMDARARIVNPGKGMRGWPEGYGFLTSRPKIQRLQISGVVAEGLEHLLDHQTGTIESLDLRDLSIPNSTKAVHHSGEAKIGTISPTPSNTK